MGLFSKKPAPKHPQAAALEQSLVAASTEGAGLHDSLAAAGWASSQLTRATAAAVLESASGTAGPDGADDEALVAWSAATAHAGQQVHREVSALASSVQRLLVEPTAQLAAMCAEISADDHPKHAAAVKKVAHYDKKQKKLLKGKPSARLERTKVKLAAALADQADHSTRLDRKLAAARAGTRELAERDLDTLKTTAAAFAEASAASLAALGKLPAAAPVGGAAAAAAAAAAPEDPDALQVVCVTLNCGNAPLDDLDRLLPPNWGTADVIAIGLQESTYGKKAAKKAAKMAAAGGSSASLDDVDVHDFDDDDDDDGDDVGAALAETLDDVGHAVADSAKAAVDSTKAAVAGAGDAILHPVAALESLGERGRARSGSGAHLGPIDHEGDHLFRHIDGHVCEGGAFSLVKHYARGEMRLFVFARSPLLAFVTDVECAAENTGIGRVLANKGGILIKLVVKRTSLAFISTHLAAHEGQKFRTERNDTVREILGGCRVGQKELDYTQFHHAFFMGDMNYRLDPLFAQDVFPISLSRDEIWNKIVGLTDKGSEGYAELHKADELDKCLADGDLLAGFRTPLCDFKPTFKMDNKRGGYSSKRYPAYCDRVLWKSLPGLKRAVRLTEYSANHAFMSSDHKPVRARFSVSPSNAPVIAPGIPEVGACPKVLLSGLKCTGLPKMDSGPFTADPYVTIYTDPPLAHAAHGLKRAKTATIKQNLNPVWKEDLLVQLTATRPQGVHLLLAVYDWDLVGDNELIGFAPVSLDAVLASPQTLLEGKYDFDLQLHNNGQARGRVQGTLAFARGAAVHQQGALSPAQLLASLEQALESGAVFEAADKARAVALLESIA